MPLFKPSNPLLLAVTLAMLAFGCAPAPGSYERKAIFPQVTPTERFKMPPLRLLAMRGARLPAGDYVAVSGEIENISAAKIDGLRVQITHYAAAHAALATDDAPLPVPALLPGQKASFEVLTRYNPQMKTYKLILKTIADGEVEYVDERGK